MGTWGSAWWTAVDWVCRILGVTTATVLFAVGLETLHQGQFSSLGVYLLVSSVAIMMLEMSYFLDALVFLCLPSPPDCPVFVFWGKMARLGGFYKFLYYSIMSVVCFLHPVLVWHAVIPGAMLLVTALFNFILSKRTQTPGHRGPEEGYADRGLTTEGTDANGTIAFFHMVTGKRGGQPALTPRDHCLDPGERGEGVQAVLEEQDEEEEEEEAAKDSRRRRWRRWREKRLMGKTEPVEREMEEMDGYCDPEPETSSDTAPMITD